MVDSLCYPKTCGNIGVSTQTRHTSKTAEHVTIVDRNRGICGHRERSQSRNELRQRQNGRVITNIATGSTGSVEDRLATSVECGAERGVTLAGVSARPSITHATTLAVVINKFFAGSLVADNRHGADRGNVGSRRGTAIATIVYLLSFYQRRIYRFAVLVHISDQRRGCDWHAVLIHLTSIRIFILRRYGNIDFFIYFADLIDVSNVVRYQLLGHGSSVGFGGPKSFTSPFRSRTLIKDLLRYFINCGVANTNILTGKLYSAVSGVIRGDLISLRLCLTI